MSENRYLEDKSVEQDYRDGGLIDSKSLIIGSVLATGSILAYRSGSLSNVIKQTLKESAEHKPIISAAFNDLRKWTKSDYGVPEKSVFRLGLKGTAKEIFNATKAGNLEDAKSIVNATREDWSLYKKRLNLTIDNLEKDADKVFVRNSHHNTDILRDIKYADEAIEAYSDTKIKGKATMKSKAYDSLIKESIQTNEKANKALKRLGVRNATIEDLFEIKIDKNGRVRLTEKTKFNFSEKNKDINKSAREQIEELLNSSVISEDGIVTMNGKKALKMHEKYKLREGSDTYFGKMIVDKSINIDEAGEIIDLRNRKKSTQEMIRNLSTEWKIPIININPLRLVGMNKVGKQKVKVGSILEDKVAPFLTGVRGNQKGKTISELKHSVDVLNGVDEAVTIINGDVYRMAEDGEGIVKMAYNSKKELIYVPQHLDSTASLTPTENSLRKMSGLSTKQFVDYNYTKEDGWKYYKQKMSKFFDIGYQESRAFKSNGFDNAMDYANPDSYFDSVASKIAPKPYKDVKEAKHFSSLSDPYGSDRAGGSSSFFVVNKNITLKDVAHNKFNKESIKKYMHQYGASFDKDYESVNRKTGLLYFMLERMNQTISSLGLGLSLDSTKSTMDTAKNLFLKRMLPIYGAYQGYQLLNTIGEDDTERPSTLHQNIMSGIAKTDIGLHAITEKMGLPKFLENLSILTPGSDMLEELPGVTALNLHQTSEDRTEYWKNGYNPVRKGRYWSLNDTPFVGGKIQYFKANPLNTALADAKYSDSQYGSRKERIASIFSPGYYDKKHYLDRPYLMSSSAFENVPLAGPILSSTVGRIIKPPVKMHTEYWNMEENRPKTKQEIAFDSQHNLGYIANANNLRKESRDASVKAYTKDRETLASIFKFNRNNIASKEADISSMTSMISKEHQYLSAYRTAGGGIRTVDLGENGVSTKYKINKKGYTPGVLGVNQNVSTIDDSYIVSKDLIENEMYSDPTNPYSLSNSLEDQYVDSMNVAGIYGFGLSSVTGNPGAGKTVIETPSYSRSFNKEFWDQELGGAGSDISEIFRRFIQKRRSDIKYYNPVRNTQANWMPGEGSFINFQEGDPYTKISRGEERLAGEGYERLNNINFNRLLNMNTGSSTIGKTKDEIIKHLLNQDSITDPDLLDIVKGGTKTHEAIEKEWMRSGLAIDIEKEIKDDKNGIIGYYDMRIHDNTAKSGEAIVDIKTISSKGFEKVKKAKAPKDVHQRQVNWYLHNTNKDNKGYLMYINRDNPEETYTVGFNYDKKMYESTMATLHEARNEIRNKLETGELSRGDLYKPIDKFRILADVAPYSDEFRAMQAELSAMELKPEEEDEFRAIRDRVKQVKEPLRLYDYRFKYSDVHKERVEIGTKINDTTYNVKGSTSPIKLAGVKLNRDHPMYKEAVEFLNKNLSEGENVTLKVSDDIKMRKNNDQLGTVKAVVYNNGVNINKALIDKGYADEDEKDFSPVGVHARFNSLQRTFGKAWENIAHFDSIANTKLLQVRTAAEDYERKQVYNKDFKEWQDPIRDFVKPSFWKNMNRGTLFGIAAGATMGYFTGDTKFAKLVGSVAGASFVAAAKMYKTGYEATTGDKWIPKEKRREREINDYMDKLKFIKNRRLFEVYADKALKEDDIDVRKVIGSNKAQGNARKRRKKDLQEVKNEAIRTGKVNKKAFEDLGVKIDKTDYSDTKERLVKNTKKLYNLDKTGSFSEILTEYKDIVKDAKVKRDRTIMKSVNSDINRQIDNRAAFDLSPNALKAIEYYNSSEKTMYGYDAGEELTNIISALPGKDRKYFRHFIEAPEREREKILSIAPKYMKRALQASYGMKVDNKEDLSSYFNEHYLPGEDWDGWQEGFNLDAMKTKIVQNEGLELGSFDIWEDDKTEADLYGAMAVPNIEYKTNNINSVKTKMRKLLGDAGYKNIDVSFQFGTGKNSINMDLYEDRKERYENKLKERLGIF